MAAAAPAVRPPAGASAPAGAATPGVEAEEWDPLWTSTEDLQRRPAASCLRRLRGELAGLRTEPLPGVHVCPDGSAATLVHALVAGPVDTPYAGGIFHFVLDAPDNYPHCPPRVRLLTTGNGTVRFNPQFYASGKVCLSILHTWPGPGWQPTFTLRVVLLQLQALMNEMPALNEPGVMLMSDPEEYNDFLRHETLRVAVLGIADEAVLALRSEEAALVSAPSAGGASSASGSGARPQMQPMPRLPAGLAQAVLDHVARHAKELEARCVAAAVATADGTVLQGLPRPTRAKYLAMAASFRAFRPAAAGDAEVPSAGGPPELAQGQEAPAPASQAHVEVQGGDVEEGGVGMREQLEPEDQNGSEPAEECRICGGGASDGELIRPCGCSGSMAYVHRRCATDWIRRDGSPTCPICRKAYSDPALLRLGALGRCRKNCAEIGRGARLCVVLTGCYLFNEATGGGLPRHDVSSRKIGAWRVEPGPSEAAQYLIRDSRLSPAKTAKELWYSPTVEVVALRAHMRWSGRPIDDLLSFKKLSQLASKRRRATSLASLLNQHGRKVVMRQAQRRGGGLLAKLRGAIRCMFQNVLEPLPSLELRLRPATAARVAATAVLFGWLAVGKRSWIWLFMCCHVGFRFAPAMFVGTVMVGAQVVAHQVQRRLARLGMFRRRPALEADLLLVCLLVSGTCCARGMSDSDFDPPEPLEALVLLIPWLSLATVAFSAAATVARPPDVQRGALARGAAVLHGLLWSLCGAFLCLLAASPALFPGAMSQLAMSGAAAGSPVAPPGSGGARLP